MTQIATMASLSRHPASIPPPASRSDPYHDLSNSRYFWNGALPYPKPYQGPHREERVFLDSTTTTSGILQHASQQHIAGIPSISMTSPKAEVRLRRCSTLPVSSHTKGHAGRRAMS